MAKSIYEFSYTSRRILRHKICSVLLFIAALYVLSAVFVRFICMPVVVRSDSMMPAVCYSDRIYISRFSARHSIFFNENSIFRGEILYVEPYSALPVSLWKSIADSCAAFFTFRRVFPFENAAGGTPVLRRVAGLPGDTLYMRDYVLYVKPAGADHFLTEFELSECQYDVFISDNPSVWDKTLGSPGVMEEITLGGDEYFVVADNRSEGMDSRVWGAVKCGCVAGRAVLKYFPLRNFRLL